MKKNFCHSCNGFFIFIIVISIMSLAEFSGCKEDEPTSLYDPNYSSRAQPVVDSISPSGGALAGIDIITVYGKNFSAVKTENTIYFDIQKGIIQTASATQLSVKVPTLVKDSVAVKVSVAGADKFSAIKIYKLIGAVSEFGAFKSFEEAYGIACDQTGNLYVSMLASNSGIGIRKYTPAGDTSKYAPKGSELFWSGIKVGPGGLLYTCRGLTAVFTVSQGVASSLYKVIPGSKGLSDLDFDKNLNIWTAGDDTAVYRINKTDKSIQPFSFVGNVRTIRVYNDFVYVGGKVDSIEAVWRAPINSSGDLGAFTKYFDLSAQPGYGFNGPSVNAITFNTEGDMYVGTSSVDAVLLVKAGSLTMSPFYQGLFVPQSTVFAWGSGSTLYITRRTDGTSTNVIIKVNTQKISAPYYGRGDL